MDESGDQGRQDRQRHTTTHDRRLPKSRDESHGHEGQARNTKRATREEAGEQPSHEAPDDTSPRPAQEAPGEHSEKQEIRLGPQDMNVGCNSHLEQCNDR